MTTRHGKPQKDFRTGRQKVERYVKQLLLPIKENGFSLADGWVDVAALRMTVKALGKRPVSLEFLKGVITENADWELSPDGTKARSLRISSVEGEGRYATPASIMFASTTVQGAQDLGKGGYLAAEVSETPSKESGVVLKVFAQRAESLGAKFFCTKTPGRLRAQNVPLECVVVMKDRGV